MLSWFNIFSEVWFIYGLIKIAILRKFSTKWYITDFNSSVLPSLNNTHGAVSSIYLFVLETKFHVSIIALLVWYVSNCSSTCFIEFLENSSNSLSKSDILVGYEVISPPKYLFIIPIVLFKRFPKSLHKSKLNLSTNPSGVNVPSCPKDISLKIKYLKASSPYLSISGSGHITFPLDLDILPSFIIINPCA